MDPIVNLTPTCGLRGKVVRAADSSIKDAQDVYEFLGVPYAEPPTGKLRFCNPQPLSLWDGVRDAKAYGAVCPQDMTMLDAMPFPVPKPEPISEDCLFLNIFTPSVDSASRLPVMFWIHGGGLSSGFSNLYNGYPLAATKGVVVVVINYRLGALGFLCTNDSAATGNYGILDQIEALKWVQQYIVHFGGDPDNVTIFGESAGGMSVSLLVLSPLARGLFRRAIAESGTVFSGDMIASPTEKAAARLRINMSKNFPDGPPATATGDEIVEFLRQQPTDAITALDNNFYAVIDGHVLPTTPVNIYASAAQNHVNLLTGVTSNEGYVIFILAARKFGIEPGRLDVATARAFIANFVTSFWSIPRAEAVIEAIYSEYLNAVSSTASQEELERILVEFIGDIMFVIPAIQAARFHSRTSKTYLYHFCHRPSFAWFPEWVQADHGTEIFYIGLQLVDGIQPSAEDVELSRQVQSYWVNFAKTGNPNGDGLVEWPEYNETSQEHLTLQLPVKADAKLKEKRANFWLRQLPELISPTNVDHS